MKIDSLNRFFSSLNPFIYLCLIICYESPQGIFGKTVSLMPTTITILRYRNFIHQIYFISSDELI